MRITRQQMWMDIAEVVARRATCSRAAVGAVIVHGRSIIETGYNGPPAGDVHCKGNACERTATGGCLRAVHAERNAIERAGPLDIFGADLYTTFSPCPECADLILASGIARVFYRHPYRIRTAIDDLIKRLEVYRITPAGIIVSERSGAIIDPETL